MNKENLTAYEVVTEENLTDIHSTGWLLRHKKTVLKQLRKYGLDFTLLIWSDIRGM